ncbi:hypothetical protein SAMN05443637_116135 [Pseudonocardia thermophila]|uniref:Secreted protein n=1 Tax=Pseudonocardia thermophila TaxID=1848 RepID=A0A1M6XAG2_PSETH|nr:hypothetical protein [Pseudonocardia thermophila]SHL02913.1 hypothetical protein SAMN05443637_116135 [Pseudonocardia thermophila]
MVRLRSVAPLAGAVALMAGAFAAAAGAGCDDPGHLERTPEGYELVGGCIAPGDVVVPATAPTAEPAVPPTAPAGEARG